MSRLSALLRVGSLTESLGVYVPAMVFQKALGLGRVYVFAVLMRSVTGEYGLWGVGMMVFILGGDLMNLGLKHGLVRYVSFYESRGLLDAFYRRMRWCVGASVLVAAAVGLCGSGPITNWVIASRGEAAEVGHNYRLWVCWAALANAGAMALYHSLLAFMSGMRTYRLVSAMEVLFSVVFTALGVAALAVQPTALAILLAHLAAVGVVLVAGVWLLGASVRSASRGSGVVEAGASVEGAFARVLRFSLAAMVGALLWLAAQYVGFQLTNRWYGKERAAEWALMFQLSQPILLIAAAAWAVVYAHVAALWERQDRRGAMFRLETAYGLIAMATMTLTLALYASAPLWVRLLPQEYRGGRELLGGLFMLFQSVVQLSILLMLCRLHERPIVAGLAGLVAAGATITLAWLTAAGGSGAAAGIARASGAGMYFGGGAVAVAYFLLSRTKLRAGTYLVLAAPVLLLLDVRIAGAAWAAMLAIAATTTCVFSADQKNAILRRR